MTGLVEIEVKTRVDPERNGKSVRVVMTAAEAMSVVVPPSVVALKPLGESALIGKLIMVADRVGVEESVKEMHSTVHNQEDCNQMTSASLVWLYPLMELQ
jgi:hypothetical protein